jgi:aspergillopepsin I
MPSFNAFVAASALASLAIANPVPQAAAPRKGFTVNQAVAKPFQPGPVALQKAFSKFGAVVPADVAAAAADGSVSATPEAYDQEYLSPVTIGGQTLNLDFDTGSSDLCVFSCPLF